MIRIVITTMVVAVLVASPVIGNKSQGQYDEEVSYIGSINFNSHGVVCPQLGDSFPYDCISGARFTDFERFSEYDLTIADHFSPVVGASWAYCYNDSCPQVFFKFCNSTTIVARPDTTIYVSVDPEITLQCGGLSPPISGIVSVTELEQG